MTQLSPKIYHWLQAALNDWRDDQLISETLREQISLRYQLKQTAFVPILIGILAALFIGGGIILVLAHNWKGLSHPLRAVISFMPLLCSQALLWWSYQRSTAARESAAVFHALALGASIALISQTYHMGGDLGGFLQVWLLLLLPVVVCYGAQSGHVGAMLLASTYVLRNGHIEITQLLVYVIVIAALALPANRGKRYFTRWFFWFYVAIVIFRVSDSRTLFHIQFKELSAILSCTAYLAGAMLLPRLHYLKNPLRFMGAMGLMGWSIYYCFFAGHKYHSSSLMIFPYWFVFALAMLLAMWWGLRQKRLAWEQMMFASIPLLIIILSFFSIYTLEIYNMLPSFYWLIMGYLIALGIALSIQGQAQDRWGKMNSGLILLISVISARFFDHEQSFLLRGILFLIIGVILLTFNLWYINKKRSAS